MMFLGEEETRDLVKEKRGLLVLHQIRRCCTATNRLSSSSQCTDYHPFPHTKSTNQHLPGWGCPGVRVARETV